MVDLGDQNISNSWAQGLHLRCPRAGLPPLEPDQVEAATSTRGRSGSRATLPSLFSQDSLLSRQTVLTHMCEELI